MSRIVGLDGCPRGWVVAEEVVGGGGVEMRIVDSLAALFQESDPEVVAIDIPIGLAAAGPRRCDRLARERLGSRRSSVFPAPVRGVLDASSYEDACRISMEASGKKLSKQAWAIVPKIAAVDRFLLSQPALASRVYEVHPEVIFAEWSDGEPMAWSKKTFLGMLHRVRLVENHFGAGLFERVRTDGALEGAADDDIVDALAALWTAERISRGEASSIPDPSDLDETGLPMRMMV